MGRTSTIITGDVTLVEVLGHTSGSCASPFSPSLFWEHRRSACFRASQRPALPERPCQLVERLVQLFMPTPRLVRTDSLHLRFGMGRIRNTLPPNGSVPLPYPPRGARYRPALPVLVRLAYLHVWQLTRILRPTSISLGVRQEVEHGGYFHCPAGYGTVTRYAGDKGRGSLNLASDAAVPTPCARTKRTDHNRDAKPHPPCPHLHDSCPTSLPDQGSGQEHKLDPTTSIRDSGWGPLTPSSSSGSYRR